MLNLSSGCSNENWISYTTVEHTSRAIRHKNGEIVTETVKDFTVTSKWDDTTHSVASYLFCIFSWFVLLIIPIIKGYHINPMIKNHEISSCYYFVSTILLVILSIIVILRIIITDPKEKLRKNHGAEHKVFTAYEKLEHIPTIDEAKHFPRICNVCGVTIYSSLITAQLIGFFIYTKYGIMIHEIVLFFVPIFLHSIFPFNFLGKVAQFFTTIEPDDDNIELAIAALTELMHAENPIYFTEQKLKENLMEEIRETN